MRAAVRHIIMGATLHPQAVALIARMAVQPDGPRKSLISDTVDALHTTGIWPLAGFMHFPASHDAQADLLCWNNAAYDMTVVGTVARTTDRGRKGDGSTGVLAIPIAPSTLPGVSQDAMTIAAWETDNVAEAASVLGLNGGASTVQLIGRSATDTLAARVNVSVGGAGSGITDGRGLSAATRDGPTSQPIYKNGVQVGTTANASGTPSAVNFCYLRSAAAYATRRIGFGGVFGILTPQRHADLYAIVFNYMTKIGAA